MQKFKNDICYDATQNSSIKYLGNFGSELYASMLDYGWEHLGAKPILNSKCKSKIVKRSQVKF